MTRAELKKISEKAELAYIEAYIAFRKAETMRSVTYDLMLDAAMRYLKCPDDDDSTK